MNDLLEKIDFFSNLTFDFSAEVKRPFGLSGETTQKTFEVITWSPKTINGLSITQFYKELSEFEKYIILIPNNIEVSFDRFHLTKANHRLKKALSQFHYERNPDFQAVGPHTQDLDFFLTKVGNEGISIFQNYFSQEEIYEDVRRDESLYTQAKETITIVLRSIKNVFEKLTEVISIDLDLMPFMGSNKPIVDTKILNKPEKENSNPNEKKLGTKISEKKRMSNAEAYNYCSDFFGNDNIEVVNTLYDSLVSARFIKCRQQIFQRVFSSKYSDKKSESKIDWIGEKGAFRYFINQIGIIFNIPNTGSTKSTLADNCFTYKGKDYNFFNLFGHGKDPAISGRICIDKILTNAKNQVSNSDKIKNFSSK